MAIQLRCFCWEEAFVPMTPFREAERDITTRDRRDGRITSAALAPDSLRDNKQHAILLSHDRTLNPRCAWNIPQILLDANCGNEGCTCGDEK